jgi:hypothetical protein
VSKDDRHTGPGGRKDHQIFLLSLGLAIIFWVASKFSGEYTQSYNFIIQYELPDSLSFTQIPPGVLRVQLSGSGWDLFKFGLNDQSREVRLIGGSARYTQTDLMTAIENQIDNPGIRIEKLSEPLVELQFEANMLKKVPVESQVDVQFAEGLTQKEEILLQPDSVLISGPHSLVSGIELWKTRSYQIRDLEEDLTVNAMLEDPSTPLLKIQPGKVVMMIRVEPLTEKTLFVPVTLTPDTIQSLNIFPSSVQITCSVGLSKFEQLDGEDFQVLVRLQKERNSTVDNYVPVELISFPGYVSHIRVHPKTVEVLYTGDQKRIPGLAPE